MPITSLESQVKLPNMPLEDTRVLGGNATQAQGEQRNVTNNNSDLFTNSAEKVPALNNAPPFTAFVKQKPL